VKTYREFLLLTEDGLVLLAEDGKPFGVIVEVEEQAGGRKRKRGQPFTVPNDLVFPVDRPVVSQHNRNVPILMMLGVM
jgi:hypothetical protein